MAPRMSVCVDCDSEFWDGSRNGVGKRCKECRVRRNGALNAERNRRKTESGYWTADTLKRKYGWTPEEFAAQLEVQASCCAICKSPEPGGHGRWHIDHDHDTNLVRGILCSNCNLGVGNVKNSPELLRNMAAYLRAHR